MLLDIKDSPLADYINRICKENGVNPEDDVFTGSSLGKKGFSIRYNELLAFAIVHNWDPAYNKNAKTILKSRKKFNQFLQKVNLLEGIAPTNILIEYLRLAKIFFKHELIITSFLESQRIYQKIEKIADSDLPTCIFGETGTGKELIANIIHKLSIKKSKKENFIILNCAGMPDDLLHKEVFGYAKRAFPGATEDHEGYLAKADGGTLFLDEIGDSGELFQKAMLRFLNDGSYNRLGDPLSRKSKCRIICTTKSLIQNFQKETKDKIRSDFYYRITRHIIYLPPLRHVRSNIPLLILLYTLATCRKFNFTDTVAFPGILLKFWLTGEKWKGNYRQLKNSVEDYVTNFIHLEMKGGYKIDQPFYNLIPLSGKWFEKNPMYILKQSKKDYAPYSRLFSLVDGHAILPFLKKLKTGEKVWNNTITDLLHMITTPYLHYALFRFNKRTGKRDYDMNSYTKYTNLRFAIDYENFDGPSAKTDSSIRAKTPRKKPKEELKPGKSNDKKTKYPIEKYISIEDYNQIRVKLNSAKVILVSNSKKNAPEITLKFRSTNIQMFSLLFFLINERKNNDRNWLNFPFRQTTLLKSLPEKYKNIFDKCGIGPALYEKGGWWDDSDSRRSAVSGIKKKLKKSPLKYPSLITKSESKPKGIYQLNPTFKIIKMLP